MAAITITKTIEDLRKIFDKVKRVYYSSTANLNLATLSELNAELPVLEDGFTFDTGAADVTRIKLTTGDNWVSFANPGDADISMQVASIEGSISDTFLDKKGSTVTMTNTLNGKAYSGQGYSTAPKKVTGALLLASEDGSALLALPNVEMYSNTVIESGTPLYHNVQITPLNNSDGASIIILTEVEPEP